MAKISLREYNREIDDLIEQGQMEQAIAHCRHILQFHPKHIDTYRLLGKAFLESQRYSDASDVLQRVLSSIPDDFVSHIGMSLIREDEGNLDEAIWHMERAFESQPSNSAIQNELKRLYGRRDGMEPPKVRLTRGALARMYLKGELFPQAVAELRSALAQEQDRPDLKLLLASAYYQAEKPVQAAEACSELLNKLPYCLLGNQIMADILANSKRADEAVLYRQRVQALEPYSAHISPKYPHAEDVPDAAVTLERLDWRPGETVGVPSQPDWATSVGVDLEDLSDGEEELPDWLESGSEEKALDQEKMEFESAPPFDISDDLKEDLSDIEPETEIEDFDQLAPEFLRQDEIEDQEIFDSSPEDEFIPEWMKEAGWEPSKGESDEVPSDYDISELEEDESDMEIDAAPADIPDWLQSMAPEDADERMETPEHPQEPPEKIEKETDYDLGVAETGAEVPDWMEDMEQEPSESDMEPEGMAFSEGDELLEDLEIEAELDLEAEEDALLEEVPDWMQEFEEAGEEPLQEVDDDFVTEMDDEAPDWMEEEGVGETSSVEAEISQKDEETPEWIEKETQPAGEDEIYQTDEPSEESEWFSEESIQPDEEIQGRRTGVTDWLKSRQEEDEAEQEPLDSFAEAEEGEGEVIHKEGEFEAEFDESEAEELPDWLQDMEGAEETEGVEAEESDLPDWLQEIDQETESELDLGEEEEVVESELVEEGKPEEYLPEDEELPDWLTEVEEEEPAAMEAEIDSSYWSTEEEGEIPGEESISLEETPITEDDTQPTRVAPAEQIPIPPPEYEEAEFIQEEATELEPGEPPLEEISQPEDITPFDDQPEEGEIPQWLQEWREETGTVTGLESEEEEEFEAAEFSKEGLEEVAYREEIAPVEDVEPEITEEPELEAMAEVEEVSPDIPSETDELEEAEEIPDLEDEDAFAWLESLAAKQGAEEALLLDPSERKEEPPEWIKKAVVGEAGTEIEMEEAEAPHSEESQFTEGALEAEMEVAEEAQEVPQAEEEAGPVAEVEIPTPVETPEEEIPVEVEKDEDVEERIEVETEPTTEPISPIQEETRFEEEAPETPEWLESIDEEAEIGEPIPTAPETMEAQPEVEAQKDVQAEDVREAEPELTTEEQFEPEGEAIPTPEPLDINSASLADLEKIPEIGFTRAQAIVAHRETYGYFTDIHDLEEIYGVGPSLISEIEDYLTVKVSPPVEAEEIPEAEDDEFLVEARNLMAEGKFDDALVRYNKLIDNNQSLVEVIQDLNDALYHHPVDVDLWQALGDAHMREGQLQEALDAYSKAEELLR